jgi:hypothetical protein
MIIAWVRVGIIVLIACFEIEEDFLRFADRRNLQVNSHPRSDLLARLREKFTNTNPVLEKNHNSRLALGLLFYLVIPELMRHRSAIAREGWTNMTDVPDRRGNWPCSIA